MRKLSLGTKLAFGTGRMAFAAKDAAFINFVMFYYTQVLGVSGTLTGLAALIGLFSDALSDPIVGSISDNYRSRYGRRHPLMAMSAIPLALSFYLLFSPPSGLGEFGAFVWLTVTAVLLRTCVTIFAIPHDALGAELSQDYEERSVIMGYRATLGWIAGVILPGIALAVVFTPQGETDGRLIANNYVAYGLMSAGVVLVTIFITCFFTRKEIPHLPAAPANPPRFRLSQPFRDMYGALSNPNFRRLFIAMLFAFGSTGVYVSLLLYVNTYFWEFSTQQLALFSLPFLLASLTAFALVKPLSKRFEKKQILIWSFFAILIIGGGWYSLRLLDLLPPNGDPWLFRLAMIQSFVAVTAIVVGQIIAPSMVADMVDEHEFHTGARKEGVFFAAVAFATKATTGFGQLVGGMVIDVVQLDPGAAPGTVDPGVVWNLGFIQGPIISLSFLVPLFLFRRLDLTRERHAEIRRGLDARSASSAAAAG